MPNPSDEVLLACWHRALKEEIGICIIVTAGEQRWFVDNLYRVRRDAESEELENLIMFKPTKDDEIFICKKLTSL